MGKRSRGLKLRREQEASPGLDGGRPEAPPPPAVVAGGAEDPREAALRSLRQSRRRLLQAEAIVAIDVEAAREVGVSWREIGTYFGLTGEGARRRWHG